MRLYRGVTYLVLGLSLASIQGCGKSDSSNQTQKTQKSQTPSCPNLSGTYDLKDPNTPSTVLSKTYVDQIGCNQVHIRIIDSTSELKVNIVPDGKERSISSESTGSLFSYHFEGDRLIGTMTVSNVGISNGMFTYYGLVKQHYLDASQNLVLENIYFDSTGKELNRSKYVTVRE